MDMTLSALHNRFQSNVIKYLAKVENFIVDPKKINTAIITEYYGSDFDGTKLELHRNIMLDIAKAKHHQFQMRLIFLNKSLICKI